MISFFYETDFKIPEESKWKTWLKNSIKKENFRENGINYIFCSDDYLLEINIKYLNHDYYTDVIGFPNSEDSRLKGDIFISVDRVKENAVKQSVNFEKELARVMIHGILHFMNYRDDTAENKEEMTKAENKYLAFFKQIN